MSARINFILKKPSKGRKSFSILKRSISSKKTEYEKVESEAIEAINQGLEQGLQTLDMATVLAKEVIKNLYKELNRNKPIQVHNSENRSLLGKYWKIEYEHREIVDFESARNDFKRAIDAVGSLSLYSASREDLQKEISKKCKGNKQRRVVSRLNTLLKFIGRDIRLRKDKKNTTEVRHLSLAEFQKILPHIEDSALKLLTECAFYTGCRVGELFAISPSSVKSNIVVVQNQIDREFNRRETKSRMIRKAFVLEEGRKKIMQWAQLKNKEDYRNTKFSGLTRKACEKAFPENKEKWCVFHDLRHSYAIHLPCKRFEV